MIGHGRPGDGDIWDGPHVAELDGARRVHPARVSSVLRVVHAAGAPPLSVEDELGSRAAAIERMREQLARGDPLSMDAGSGTSGGGGGGGPEEEESELSAVPPPSSGMLSSAWFCAGVPSGASQTLQLRRGRTFAGAVVAAVQSALGGEASPDEASALAMAAYKAWAAAAVASAGEAAVLSCGKADPAMGSHGAAGGPASLNASATGAAEAAAAAAAAPHTPSRGSTKTDASRARAVGAACTAAAAWQAHWSPVSFRGLLAAASATTASSAADAGRTAARTASAPRFASRLRLVPDWAWDRATRHLAQPKSSAGKAAAPGGAGAGADDVDDAIVWQAADVTLLAELISGGSAGRDAAASATAAGAGGWGAGSSDPALAVAGTAVAGEGEASWEAMAAAGAVSGSGGSLGSGASAGGTAAHGSDASAAAGDMAAWLLDRCREVARSGALPADSLASGIAAAARASVSRGGDPGDDAALQMALFELVGDVDGGFELLQAVLARVPAIAALSADEVAGRKPSSSRRGGHGSSSAAAGGGATAAGAPSLRMVGHGASDDGDGGTGSRSGQRQSRAGRRGRGRGAQVEGGVGEVMAAGIMTGGAPASEEAAAAAALLRRGEDARRLDEAAREDAANAELRALRELVGGTGDSFVGAVDRMKASLPPGSTYESFKDHIKIQIPAPLSALRDVDEAGLVRVDELEDWAQVAFAGTERLNPLQSAVFETAYRSSENVLVCAPTGAGKTNVAMLAVCRELSQHFVDGVLQRDDFKIVYVAPMKALAAEVTDKFGKRLAGLGVRVRELTGDMQLTRREIAETQMLVVTPEKWDVITRKSGEGGGGITQQVRLLIIDEVHLLADGRGAVIESLVARTLRQVEASQSIIRLVGLSATLPNYQDVGLFLRVNPESGLFHFGPDFRPVPLAQTFFGVAERNAWRRRERMTELAFDKCVEALEREKQVMVFVHSRKDTGRTGMEIASLAAKSGAAERLFASADEDGSFLKTIPKDVLRAMDEARAERGEPPLMEAVKAGRGPPRRKRSGQVLSLLRQLGKSKNHELRELVGMGIGIHHAGMLRSDRNLAEQLFMAGEIKVLCCTATLAWGVNLPAHTVIIKGTDVYNAEAGGFVDLSVLDVLQIFGRAGRPQFDTEGEACIITTSDKLSHYQQRLLRQTSIESSFIKSLPDHLNAEIVSGSVANVREAVIWMSYTYLFVRMLRNPTAYGIRLEECRADPMLEGKRIELVCTAARRLDECRLIRYDERSGALAATDMGRVASHFYIRHESMDLFYRELARRPPTDEEALALLCRADEFQQLRVRDEELKELAILRKDAPFSIKGELATTEVKTNILLQAYVNGVRPRTFTLVGDTSYITQSAGRIARGLFEISVRRGWCSAATAMLSLCKAVDRRVWAHQTPLRQLAGGYGSSGHGVAAAHAVPWEAITKLEATGGARSMPFGLDRLADMTASDIGAMLHYPRAGPRVKAAVEVVPHVYMQASAQPITRSVLRVALTVTPDFRWVDRVHGAGTDPWWIWVEDDRSEQLYHHELVSFSRGAVQAGEEQRLTFTIPVPDPMPPQLWVRATHDRWQGVEETVELPLRTLVLPDEAPPHTDLLDLVPLPKSALQCDAFESIFSFSHFNPIQTQIFHVLYHTDHNVLLGAPTGSGKTVAAELAVFRLFNERPGSKAVYIAPLKALVSERIKDWGRKFGEGMGKRVVELTGDVTPDAKALQEADILVTTPEKWDGISRSWQRRGYVKKVGLVIIDEIHLLGEDRGPVLEVIVSRMRFIAAHTGSPVRIVGLSTALANAADLADWLGIDRVGLYNFRPSVRPIPMDVHIQGFPGKHYCPRMATMNKPIYAAVAEHSPDKPALVFVSSRRQTRLTALDLISLCATDDNPRRFLRMDPESCQALVDARVKDTTLKHTLVFGVGMHHAGLPQSDRDLVEELFVGGKIQVLVCTSTLAWGVNFPAHLVVVKGTEYFDGKLGRYVDFAITDVLQMMGRAGRPQFDDDAVAVIMVHEPKKQFYRKFLYEPFPVESQLLGCLHDHINAEIAAGTIRSRADAADWLTWTYFFRRLVRNPSFYHLDATDPAAVSAYLAELVDTTLADLERSGCVLLGEEAAEALGVDPQAEQRRATRQAKRREAKAKKEAMGVLGMGLEAITGGKAGGKRTGKGKGWGDEAEDQATASAAAAGRKRTAAGAVGANADDADDDDDEEPIDVQDLVAPSTLGHISSFYYLSHATAGMVEDRLLTEAEADTSLAALEDHSLLLRILCDAAEFDELPVRHNEELLNEQLAELLPWAPGGPLDDPHVKAFLLLQAHMARVPLPISDFLNDTRSVLDQAPRVLNAMVDVAANAGLLPAAVALMELSQCLAQARFPFDSTLLQLPRVDEAFLSDVHAAVIDQAGAAADAAARTAALELGIEGVWSDKRQAAEPEVRAVGMAELLEALAAEPNRGTKGAGSPLLVKCLASLGGAAREKVAQSLTRDFPLIDLRWTLRSADTGEELLTSSTAEGEGRAVACGSGLELRVEVRSAKGPFPRKAPCPMWAKPRGFGWWLVVGDEASGELLAVKRVGTSGRGGAFTLSLDAPDVPLPGGAPWEPVLMLVSDVVMGLDQQLSLSVPLVEAAAVAAVATAPAGPSADAAAAASSAAEADSGIRAPVGTSGGAFDELFRV